MTRQNWMIGCQTDHEGTSTLTGAVQLIKPGPSAGDSFLLLPSPDVCEQRHTEFNAFTVTAVRDVSGSETDPPTHPEDQQVSGTVASFSSTYRK